MFTWNDLVKALQQAEISHPHLKVVQLAQAILESGRGSSDLFTLHGNPYGMKYRPEMRHIAVPVEYEAHDGKDVYCKFLSMEEAVQGYWIFMDRPVYAGWRHNALTPEAFLEFIAFAGYIGGPHDGSTESAAQKNSYIAKVRGVFPEAENLLGLRKAAGQCKVLLEVGHGLRPDTSAPGGYDPGAVNPWGKKEHALNVIAARAAEARLTSLGVPCEVTDASDTLFNLGKLAEGHDVFCSIHHNCANGSAQGAEAHVHATLHSVQDVGLANAIAASLAKGLGITDRNKKNGTPKSAFGVLHGAKTVGCPAATLAELYFMDVYCENFEERSRLAGEWLADGIAEFCKKKEPSV